LAGFLGYHIITRVPPLLHTPLMSATNAIAGISLVGSLVVAGADYGPFSTLLGFIAVMCSSTNVVGGFLITDRMLKMFKTSADADAAKKNTTRNVVIVIAIVIAAGLALLFWGMSQGQSFGILLHEKFSDHALKYSYIISAALFILGLKGLSSPKHARKGMFAAEAGMMLAVVGTLFHHEIVTYQWIIIGFVLGAVVGGTMGLRTPMTAVPQRTALSHSLGALAACLVGVSEYFRHGGEIGKVVMTALGFEVVIGGLTFTGSLMAAAKLQELLPGRPITYKGQNIFNFALLAVIVGSLIYLVIQPQTPYLFYVMVGLSLLFGLLLVIPIGAADMPVVIALLNSYGGLADASMGFVLMNKIQIITGSLDGTSGFLLSLLMCRAMNRSAFNVLFGAFGKLEGGEEAQALEAKGSVRSITPDEVSTLLDSFRSVIIVPGYGMAVAQAQHGVAELAKEMQKRGINVKYAIHPVAGRMPGHMNVLLAEANVPYDQLYTMEQINPYFPEADLALIVGANDVTNPAARSDKNSPLYGMPILEVDRARSIIVLKRSMRPGFAGVDNELYYDSKCMMLFGDAKQSLNQLFGALKSGH
ncbi:MAG TPA: NAD(P)(+) transhydrogenase (Re/Si-specific) subunit beta, partial [Acidobacteriota bacterium]|nr:NAD(P)(+) transhydrogenase (Re/Si-specific) subunit beta [Acidobacteriota bacterium]